MLIKIIIGMIFFLSVSLGSSGYTKNQTILYSSYFLPNIVKTNNFRNKLVFLRKKYNIDIRLYITNQYYSRKSFTQKLDKEILDNNIGEGYDNRGIILGIETSKHKVHNRWKTYKFLKIGITIKAGKIFNDNFVEFLEKNFNKNIKKKDIYYSINILLKYIKVRLKQTNAGYFLKSNKFLKKIKEIKALEAWQNKYFLPKDIANKFVDLLNKNKYYLAAHLVDKKSYMFFIHNISNNLANQLIFQKRKCGNGDTIVNFTNTKSVIRYKSEEQSCMPWMFKVDNMGFWKIDFLAMQKYIILKNNRVFLPHIKSSDYGFAYYDVKVDNLGNLSKLTNKLGIYLVKNKDFGMIVFAVQKGSIAESAGILPGDIILNIAGKNIKTFYDFNVAMLSLRKGKIINIKVQRNGKKLIFKVTLS